MVKDETADHTPYRVALSKLAHVRTEMAKVYREARGGSLTTKDMNRFVYALRMIGSVIEVESLEARLDALESGHEATGTAYRAAGSGSANRWRGAA
jgi:hypothetical protein